MIADMNFDDILDLTVFYSIYTYNGLMNKLKSKWEIRSVRTI